MLKNNDNYNEFINNIKKISIIYLQLNFEIKDRWSKINDAFSQMLDAEKKMRRHFSSKSIVNEKAVFLAKNLEEIFLDSEEIFKNFYNNKVFETLKNMYDNLKKFLKLISDDQNFEKFIIEKFKKFPKTADDFKYCIHLFKKNYSTIKNLSYLNFIEKYSENEIDVKYTAEHIQLFKLLFSCLEQVVVEKNSYDNFNDAESIKRKFKEFENEIIYDFVLNYCDRNTTIFVLTKLMPIFNEQIGSEQISVVTKDFIFKEYFDLFPFTKLIIEIRNSIEHRPNSYNVDLNFLNFQFVFILSMNLVFMTLITVLYLNEEINLENIINN